MVLRRPAKARNSTQKSGTGRLNSIRRKARAKLASGPAAVGPATAVSSGSKDRSPWRNDSILIGVGGSTAPTLTFPQFLFFLASLLFFLDALLGSARGGLFLAPQFSEFLFLVRQSLGGAVQRVGELIHGITKAGRILRRVGIRRLLDTAQLLQLLRTASQEGAQAAPHVPLALVLIINPALHFIVERDVLAEEFVEIRSGVIFCIGGFAAESVKACQARLFEVEVNFYARRRVLR